MDKAIITKLHLGAKELSLDLTAGQYHAIEGYIALLQKWNRVFNLTAINDPTELMTHHILDSLAIQPFFKSGDYFLDVGTGAGLPGMMLAIVFPEKSFTLLDSNSKKTSFIKQAAYQLGMKNVEVVTARLESWTPPQPFDGVVSRAFASLPDFVKGCARLIKPGEGRVLAMKGPRVIEELKTLASPQGFHYSYQLHKIYVPFLNEERYLVSLSN